MYKRCDLTNGESESESESHMEKFHQCHVLLGSEFVISFGFLEGGPYSLIQRATVLYHTQIQAKPKCGKEIFLDAVECTD